MVRISPAPHGFSVKSRSMCLKAAPEDGQKARDSAFFQVWSAAALPLSVLHDLYLDHHSIYEDVRCCSLVNTDTISGCVVLVGRGSIGLLSNNAPVRAAVDKHWRVRASDFCPGKGAFRRTTSSPICLRTCRQRRRRTAAGPHSIASDNLFAHYNSSRKRTQVPFLLLFHTSQAPYAATLSPASRGVVPDKADDPEESCGYAKINVF